MHTKKKKIIAKKQTEIEKGERRKIKTMDMKNSHEKPNKSKINIEK